MGDFSYSMGDSLMVLTARFRLTRTRFRLSRTRFDSLENDFPPGGLLYIMGDFHITWGLLHNMGDYYILWEIFYVTWGIFLYSLGDSTMVIPARFRLTWK